MLVPLTRGQSAIIDDADAHLIAGRRWMARPVIRCPGVFYAQATSGRSTIYMHRLILGAVPGEFVDHINRDGLDNRRVNLRLATIGQNNTNRITRAGASGFRGVYKTKDKFSARIWKDGRSRSLGSFQNPAEAARAFDDAARKIHGDFAVLNFPEVH